MPRFVVLYHELPPNYGRPSHYDLMLERGAALRTWALLTLPHGTEAVAAEQLADHRPAYLEFEGPVSGGRGCVTRWDSGQFELLSETENRLEFELHGSHLNGRWLLSRDEANPGEDQRWVFGRA